jgi:predicted Zn-dependent protease
MTAPQEFAQAALAASTADGCVVIAEEHSEINLRWAANALTTNGQMRTRAVTVISTFDRSGGTSAGVVTAAVATLDEIDDLVRASEAAGRVAAPAEDASPLVEPYPHDDDWTAEAQPTSIEVFEQLADDLGAEFGKWRRADRLLFGFAEHQLTSYFLASSTGVRRRFDQPDGRLEMNGKAADFSRSAWDGLHSRDFLDVDVVAVAAGLQERMDWAARSVDLAPGRHETILPPTAVADLMLDLYRNAVARDADEGRNAFAAADGGTRIGEQLSSLPVSLRSDPAEPGLQCAPFEIATVSSAGRQSVFDNGLPVDAASWISAGTLTDLVRTRAWARSTDTAARPAVGNLIMDAESSGATLAEMIANTERGLLLTCLWYIREVDPQTLLLTGLTRDGVYLVENGQVRGAVHNFRFNESPLDLLSRATEIGRTEHTLPREWSDYFRRAAMPPLRIPDFNMSTVSPAS